MNCIEIVKKYLDERGYDGLQSGTDCGCEISDLVPCGNDFSQCIPGYKIIPPKDTNCEFEFYICQRWDDRPWET